MFEPEVEYTYWPPEPPVPYEPTTDPARTQQEAFASPYTMPSASIARTSPERPKVPARTERANPVMPRMSKVEALTLVDEMKRWLVAGAFVTFGVLAGLVAGQIDGSANSAGNQQGNNQIAPSFNAPNAPDDGGFFHQGGDNFGNGNNGQPFSGTHHS